MKALWLLLLLAVPLSAPAGNLVKATPLAEDSLLDTPPLPLPGDGFLMSPAIRGAWQVATSLTSVPEADSTCHAFLDRVQKIAVAVGQGDTQGDIRRNAAGAADDHPVGVDTLYVHLPLAHVEEVWVCMGDAAPEKGQQNWARFTPLPLQAGQASLITQAQARHLPLDG